MTAAETADVAEMTEAVALLRAEVAALRAEAAATREALGLTVREIRVIRHHAYAEGVAARDGSPAPARQARPGRRLTLVSPDGDR